VAEDDNSDDYKLTLAQQIFGKALAITGRHPPEPKTSDVPAGRREPVEDVVQQKQLKTAAELAEMIELDLARHPDCPKAGFRVTVYGGSYWRAMLTITPAAGGIRNPQEWRDLTNDFAERLRKHYDLAWQ
jgi:hypothetical protein